MFLTNQTIPYAVSRISGSSSYPEIEGTVLFYEVYGGTFVVANVKNLPKGNDFHGFHIHAGSSCMNMMEGGHYNPTNMPHPQHAGDLPPLLANDGVASGAFYTNRFYPEEIVGKVVVIHLMPDDFKTQPSGNAGEIVACGEIREMLQPKVAEKEKRNVSISIQKM